MVAVTPNIIGAMLHSLDTRYAYVMRTYEIDLTILALKLDSMKNTLPFHVMEYPLCKL